MKCFAAFCVVCIHYGSFCLTPIVRCAVPFFFILTGYYYPALVERGNFWRHIRKLLVMVLCASALYGAWKLHNVIRNDTLQPWIDKTFSLRHIGYCIAFDEDLFGFHLWYFYAVLYDLIIFRLADRWKLTGLLRCAAPLLLLMFFIGNFITPWNRMTRNFIFMGLPCMMLGRLIREHNDGKFSFLADSRYLWAYVCGSLALVVVEMFVLNKMYADRGVREMYMFTLPMLLPLFYCALRNPSFGEGSVWAVIGRKYSAYIYIFHVLVSQLLSLVVPWNTSLLTIAVYPFVVFGISLGVSWMFLKIVGRCRTTRSIWMHRR